MSELREKSFDLGSVLRKHQKKHKSKPTQFESIAGGVQRRMEKSLKQRKSSRLTAFDYTRNLLQPSPEPVSEAKKKADSRLQQLQKWKAEKEKKKKEIAANKPKPFLAGVPHNPPKHVLPPLPRAVPSSSGRITRSQSARNEKEQTNKHAHSFAPSNAGFRAPQLKNLTKPPQLEPLKKQKDTQKFNFNPVLHTAPTVRTRSQAYQRIVAESKAKKASENSKGRMRVIPKLKSKFVSSSSSENESQMQTAKSSSENDSSVHSSASSGDIDFTTKMISSSEDMNIHSSTENDSSKSLHRSSSSELPLEKPGRRKSLRFISRTATPLKSVKAPTQDKSKLNTPSNPVPKSESNSEERLRSPKSPMTPEQIAEEFKSISPCVTMSRGKDNARKEMKKKMEEGLLDEDMSDMESVEHFQRQLDSEIKRITEICDSWDKVYEQVCLPESIQGLLLGAVGQARLLMSQKMQQFSGLVQRCARPEPGATLVTPADLRGFWDMLFIQVENVGMRFKELEELQARNWVEEVAPAPRAARRPRVARAPARPRAAASQLRDVIAAARKAKTQQAQSTEGSQPPERTFEAGFFCVRSPARSPRTPATPRHSLLKAVLSSEAEKASASKKSASFAMLRASVLGKCVECEGVAPLPPSPVPEINLHATPGRSILKQPQNNNSTLKQCKVVLFDQKDIMNTSTEDLNLSKERIQNTSTEASNLDLHKEQINGEKVNLDLPYEIINTDAHVSPMGMDEKESKQRETEKENSKRRSSRRMPRLSRQDAVETLPCPSTRRTRSYMETLKSEDNVQITSQLEKKSPPSEKKNLQSEKKTTKRSAQKKIHAEVTETPQNEQEPQQTEQITLHSEKKSSRRSTRKKVLTEVGDFQTPRTESEAPQSEQKKKHSEKKTPKRSTSEKVLTELEINGQKENYTPMRSTRRKKTYVIDDVC